MEYICKDDLEELRRSNKNKEGVLELYAVYFGLNNPIMKIKKLSKKYVYWEDNSQHPYPSKNAGYRAFDNKSEAWKYYKKIFEAKKRFIYENYKADMKKLEIATKILNKCAEETPEYFL